MTMIEKREIVARKIFEDRQRRREHPDGDYESGIWQASDSEKRDCCADIRTPQRKWNLSMMHHCRTLKHIRNLVTTWTDEQVEKYYNNINISIIGR